MNFDDKLFELIILEPKRYAILKQEIDCVCKEHGKLKIQSASVSKIVVNANECVNEEDLRNFTAICMELNDICKIHLQYPHDVIFPAEIQCSSENVKIGAFFSGFLYSYKFIRTTTLLQNQPFFNIPKDFRRISNNNNYNNDPHSNWYHDDNFFRLILPAFSNIRFEFKYSSFLKIYVHQLTKTTSAVSNRLDFDSVFRNFTLEEAPYHLSLTIGIAYPPNIYAGEQTQSGYKFSRVFNLSKYAYLGSFVRSSTIQLKLCFDSEKGCRDFISHLHSPVTCPIIFLSQPLEPHASEFTLSPPSTTNLPWEIDYAIQMIMDFGDIGCYHFQKQSYVHQLQTFITNEKNNEAVAFLTAIHANLKLQPMMEVIEDPRPITVNLGEDYVMMRTVIITPTRKICCPAMSMMSSRAFRILGGDKFIQVKYRDEDMISMKPDEAMMKQVVLDPGINGIVIAGKRFFELARSNSMFREHSSYFYQTDDQDNIVAILKYLGNFKPEPSSKTAARIGQYFTSTKEVNFKLETHDYAIVGDYMSTTRNSAGENYCFSDGVGIISLKFANYIKEQFKYPYLPSAFQFRFLGFKGVLSIDDKDPLLIDAGGKNLILFRESQKKFDVPNKIEAVLGIVKYSAPAVVRFNKPLINLWDQAATKQGFSKNFDKRVNQLFSESLYHITSTLNDNKSFNEALQKLPNYANFQQTVRQVWINEPFFRSMVTAAALQRLRSLQDYKQITLPHHLGRSMLGIVDLTGILKEGQVFVQYSKHVGSLKDDNEKIICTGKIAVSRSPVYNIGDLRILKAVDYIQFHHLCDVIVFPNHGFRPHPDEMGGGDLDGDEYSVIWDPELMIDHSEEAADYAPTKNNPDIHRIEQLPLNSAYFRYEYMMKDYLAKISNCHLAHSDLHSLEHPKVVEMAKNADLAVNYFKSGVPADDIPNEDMCDWYPNFMDKNHLPSYTSPRLLGRLHQKCDRFWNVITNIVNENKCSKALIDPVYDVNGWEEYKDDAIKLYKAYNSEIEHLKTTYGIKSEGELFSNQLGNILGRLRKFDADNSTAHTIITQIQNHVFEIFGRYRVQFLTEIGENLGGRPERSRSYVIKCITSKAKKLAVAYYKVAYEDGGSLSFPWIAWDALDAVWTENGEIISSEPIYDLINKTFARKFRAASESNFDEFKRRIKSWLKKFEYSNDSLTADLKIAFKYVFKGDTRDENQLETEFSNASKFGQQIVEFLASIGSFEFLVAHPNLKALHEIAQQTYCRITFAPLTLTKSNVFKEHRVRGSAFVVAIPQELKDAFYQKKESLKLQSGCSQISFRVRKKTKFYIHISVWSHGTLSQNETLKEILTITPQTQNTSSFEAVRLYKHQLQQSKIFD